MEVDKGDNLKENEEYSENFDVIFIDILFWMNNFAKFWIIEDTFINKANTWTFFLWILFLFRYR